ncbi:competence type IV pilus assembly protein ComGB [Streptococcus porcinus]|uniref:competence type IV pilus assembly protein ComGB n=1 Tax=Streptococcus porcinus TaxID=1340 RepID=UPI0024355BA5|nr:competence type IV pilus assembly protein ComGB [Streptococcus porcinus]
MKSGIKSLTTYLQKDISLNNRHSRKKLATKKQAKLIQLLHNLSQSGFNLAEMIAFLEKTQILDRLHLNLMKTDLLNGCSLSEMMRHLGFPDGIVTQLSLAEAHGNTKKCLGKVEDYLVQTQKIRQKTIEVVTYPIILLTFLILIVLGLRHYLMPQIEKQSTLTYFLNNFPVYLLSLSIIILLTVIALVIRWRKLGKMKQIIQYSRIPLLASFLKLYMTAFYAREWGNLISQGIELSQIVTIMSIEKSDLIKEIGLDMRQSFLEGQSFHEKVKGYPFFSDELSLMIEYGEIKGKLGQELDIYGQLTWDTYFRKLFQATQIIQPFIFMIVALIIVMIYAAMLLPMYNTIGGTI